MQFYVATLTNADHDLLSSELVWTDQGPDQALEDAIEFAGCEGIAARSGQVWTIHGPFEANLPA